MKQNFNRAPYYDDFDPAKNYMSVLFRPGRPVQGRELNVLQSIKQGQIETFANHIFKNGSRITGARSSFIKADYVRLRATVAGGTDTINVEQFPEGTQVVGSASGLKATLQVALNAEGVDPATLYVSYLNTAIDGVTTTFVPGEDIEFKDSNGVTVLTGTVRCPSCPGSSEGSEVWPTGRGHVFVIEEGAFYFEGMFINNSRQQIVVSKYSYPKGQADSAFAGKKIGFDFIQNVVTADDDRSLSDPSLGYPNATAPGADRYQVELVLNARSYDAEDGESFILLGKMNAKYDVEFIKSDSEYSDIMDALAKRTYETNGNYTIRPFKVSFYEHKKKDALDAKGWDINGDPENIIALMSPSVAYVRGYRVETISDTPLAVRKARDTAKAPSFIKRFDQRTYLTLKPSNQIVWPGRPDNTGMTGEEIVTITDQPAGAGAVIGRVRINDIEYVSGLNTDASAVYKYSISDLTFTVAGKTMKDAKSFVNAATGFLAAPVADAETLATEVYEANRNALVFGIEKSNIKSLRDVDNALNGSLSIVSRRKLTATLDSAGQYTFNSATNEFFEAVDKKTIAFVTTSGNVTTTIPLTGSNTSVSPTSFTVNFGATHAGKTVTVLASLLKTNQKEKTKTLNTSTLTTASWPGNLSGTVINLGKADVLSVEKVELYDHANVGTPVLVADVTANYTLKNGQNDWFYGESSIVQGAALTQSTSAVNRLHVTFKYFEHSGTEGYFTVDSYSGVINDPGNDITYADIPVFVSSTGEQIPLITAFDFRPILLSTGTATGTVPANDSTAIFDVEYYLPRSDLIQINKEGQIYVKYGAPADKPTLPQPDADAMVLYHLFLQAYTYSTDDVKVKFIENKRYTMRDIGRLEDRIKNVEYYTMLNLLEKSAADMSIKDQNGLDRFKNGFIADNFADFQAADVTNPEFKAGADRTRRELRPSFKAKNFGLVPVAADSENVQWIGKVATLPFISESSSSNPYATKNISINPYFFFNRKGTVALSPNVDTWTDEDRLPDVVTNIDSGMDALRAIGTASGLLGTDWGTWVDQNSTILASSTSTVVDNNLAIAVAGGRVGTNLTTTVTTVTNQTVATNQSRAGTLTTLDSRVQSYSVNDVVKDVQVIPYVRSRPVEFYAAKLRPNTRIYAFFDGVNVSAHCRDIGFSLNNDNATTRAAMVAYGSPMFTDANGNFKGEFLIPGGQFFTGKSTFRLSNDPAGTGDPDVESSSAEATYFSGGLDLTIQDSTLNITTPVLNQTQVADSRTTVTTNSQVNAATSVVFTPVLPPTRVARLIPTGMVSEWVDSVPAGAGGGGDPVAQQFFVDEDQMLTGLDIYFQTVDQTSNQIWVELRQMTNGYPAPGVLARREYAPSQLTFSEDSSVPMHVNFDVPVFVQGGGEYCFVVGGWSPNTRIWVAKLGEEVVNMPGKIVETQPTLGSSFRSQNNKTWNAEQFETIKYNLYRARFTESTMNLKFVNDENQDEFVQLPENPLETQAGSDFVRVFIPSHGLNVNDRVRLALYDELPVLVQVTGLPPQVGQFFHTATGSGTITKVETTGITDQYYLSFAKMTGRFLNGQTYTADAMVKNFRDYDLLTSIGGSSGSSVQINQATGKMLEDSSWGGYINGAVNGISVDELNVEHIVKGVDSIDSIIVQVTTPAVVSQRSGGAKIKAYASNFRYETFNIAGSYLAYSAAESWRQTGTLHGVAGGVFESQDYGQATPVLFKVGTDVPLAQPYKVASKDNETRVFGSSGQKSVIVDASFVSSNPLLSPVVDTSTFSMTGIANRVDFTTADSFNVIPNASNRFVAETDPLLGSEVYKYVTQTVNLANPASDLMIFFDYFKDNNADFDVYVKKIPVYEDRPVDQLPWLKVEIPSKKNSQNIDDRIEIEIRCSEQVAGWKDAEDTDIPFVSFRVKIVGKAKNTATPPMFQSFRAIAVT